MTTTDKKLRKQLVDSLHGGQAHAPFEDAVKHFPPKLRGVVPQGLPYSAWQVLEHIRLAQDDIVRFSMNSDGSYHAPNWPEDYWPKSAEPPSAKSWDESVHQVKVDREQMIQLIENPSNDLLAPFPWGDGQNLLREALLVANHGSYHIGELIVIRRLLGAWPAK